MMWYSSEIRPLSCIVYFLQDLNFRLGVETKGQLWHITDQKCILTPGKDIRFWKSFLNAMNKLSLSGKGCSFNNIWQKQFLFLTFFTTLISKVFCFLKRCLIFVGSVHNFAQRIEDICFPLKSPFLLFQQKIQIFNWLYPSCKLHFQELLLKNWHISQMPRIPDPLSTFGLRCEKLTIFWAENWSLIYLDYIPRHTRAKKWPVLLDIAQKIRGL